MARKYKYIGIAKYPGVQLAAVYGLTDMLMTANTFIQEQENTDKTTLLFCLSHWELDTENSQLEATFCTLEKSVLQQDVIVILGTLDTGKLEDMSEVVINWIRKQHAAGAIASSVCKGAFALAKSGILSNRRATTHWAFEEEFSALYPDINLEIDKMIVDDGDVITAGGVMAWLDLGLRLIHQFAGPEVMVKIAKFLLIDPSGREQKFYRAFSPPMDHGDTLIIKIQHWLQANYGQLISLEKLADMTSISVRTLIRRFHNSLAMSPTAYIQQVRVGQARELLEFTTLAVNQIAWKVGYEDPGSFSKIFQRNIGLTPAEYRRRFDAH
ncbi:MAG: GlxA family transcriptional regulator [Alcanivoracaceae bacterium]|nr:GlxA family transcriptional regulator [Alcanivoracaceae bacterium]